MFYKGKRRGFADIGSTTGSLEGLNIDDSIEDYLRYHKVVEGLEEVFNQVLDVELQGKVSIASYAQGCLGVFCDDATSASVMRYAANDYIARLKDYSVFSEIKAIKVRVKNKS